MASTAEETRGTQRQKPQPQKTQSKGLGQTVVRSLRESALWVFGALALLLLIALASYDRNDPSFVTTGEPGPVNNLIGSVGAQFAG